MNKKTASLLCTAAMLASVATGCTAQAAPTSSTANSSEATAATATASAGIPKYVFLFIGDGMSYPQIQLTNYYLSASGKDASAKTVSVDGEQKTVLQSANHLTMMDFPIAGSAQTYDSTSFAPDSASTATSIATGFKTWSGSINVSEDFKTEYETIA